MATRGNIIVQVEAQKFVGLYTHSDGYPSWNGVLLDRFHRSNEAAQEIANLGCCSVLDVRLAPEPGEAHEFDSGKRAAFCSVFYGRDRGDTPDELFGFQRDNLQAALDQADHCYTYVWLLDGDGWLFSETVEGLSVDMLKPLADFVANDEECQERVTKWDAQGKTLAWRDAGCPHSTFDSKYGPQYLSVPLNADGSIPATATFGEVFGSEGPVGELPVYTVGLYEPAPAPVAELTTPAPAPAKKRNVAKKADKKGFAYQEGAWA